MPHHLNIMDFSQEEFRDNLRLSVIIPDDQYPTLRTRVQFPIQRKMEFFYKHHRVLVMVSNFHVEAVTVCSAPQRPYTD